MVIAILGGTVQQASIFVIVLAPFVNNATLSFQLDTPVSDANISTCPDLWRNLQHISACIESNSFVIVSYSWVTANILSRTVVKVGFKRWRGGGTHTHSTSRHTTFFGLKFSWLLLVMVVPSSSRDLFCSLSVAYLCPYSSSLLSRSSGAQLWRCTRGGVPLWKN